MIKAPFLTLFNDFELRMYFVFFVRGNKSTRMSELSKTLLNPETPVKHSMLDIFF